jgi:hypothetical protein
VLHRYYATTAQLSNDQLAAQRQELDCQDPSLGTRAGKAFAALQRETVMAQAGRSRVAQFAGTEGPRRLSVSAVFRPEPDIAKLVQAFLRLAEQQRQARQDDEQLPSAA